jgi:hypothetical protein
MRFVDKQRECFNNYDARNTKRGVIFFSSDLIIACLSGGVKKLKLWAMFRSLNIQVFSNGDSRYSVYTALSYFAPDVNSVPWRIHCFWPILVRN